MAEKRSNWGPYDNNSVQLVPITSNNDKFTMVYVINILQYHTIVTVAYNQRTSLGSHDLPTWSPRPPFGHVWSAMLLLQQRFDHHALRLRHKGRSTGMSKGSTSGKWWFLPLEKTGWQVTLALKHDQNISKSWPGHHGFGSGYGIFPHWEKKNTVIIARF